MILTTRYWCPSCGMVRDSDVAPWCRHNDGDRALPATRMEVLPTWHPLAWHFPSMDARGVEPL